MPTTGKNLQVPVDLLAATPLRHRVSAGN